MENRKLTRRERIKSVSAFAICTFVLFYFSFFAGGMS